MKIKGKLIDGKIIVERPKDVGRLYNKSRLGNMASNNKLELDLIEGCFLLDEGKIEIKKEKSIVGFESISNIACKKINDFDAKYLAFKDLRKRGCIIRPADKIKGITFSDYKKEFFVCVFSEGSYFNFKEVFTLIKNAEETDVKLYFAVVDFEGDVTYYDVSKLDLKGLNKTEKYPKSKGLLSDNGVMIYDRKIKDLLFKNEFFGKYFGEGLRISFVEALYLIEKKIIEVKDADGKSISYDNLIKISKQKMPNFENIYSIYKDLKQKGLIVKTGFKFGSDFRVYTKNPDEVHAEYLVQTVERKYIVSWSEMSRIIRLAHSVNKEIVFACVDKDKNHYVRFGRLRP